MYNIILNYLNVWIYHTLNNAETASLPVPIWELLLKQQRDKDYYLLQ